MVTRTLTEDERGEILASRDSLGAIRDILSRSGSHGRLLCQPGRATTEESGDEEKSTSNPLSLLQSQRSCEKKLTENSVFLRRFPVEY
jgi:hypothetical protein